MKMNVHVYSDLKTLAVSQYLMMMAPPVISVGIVIASEYPAHAEDEHQDVDTERRAEGDTQ